MTDQLDPIDNYPDWKDGGRQVEAMHHGSLIRGRLRADEEFTGVDEFPVFSIEVDDKDVSLVDCDWFRYL